ncbi:MAG: acyl-CoA dehydrogenase family protein [Pirellulaceae bacterium]
MRLEIDELCQRLTASAPDLDRRGRWPQQQLNWCGEAGVFRWFIPEEYGGWNWSEEQITDGYLALSQSCLTTTFILTQWNAACRRILGSENVSLRERLLPKLAAGEIFATVGISHLTTSRQHLAQPVLRATESGPSQWRLDGFSPWVTGAPAADVIVLGASLDDGRQMLAAVPRERTGLAPQPGAPLMALSASCTDRVDLDQVKITDDDLIAGPVENVMQTNSGGGAGGLQTSTLAIGLTFSAVEFLKRESQQREDLRAIADKLDSDAQRLRLALRELVTGCEGMLQSDLRQQANSLVLRSTQAALQAAKGAGFMASHPAGRWAREAMFFLVWSCPQPVAHANLCELAQLS